MLGRAEQTDARLTRTVVRPAVRTQLLVSNGGKYQVWRSWGRVGGEEGGSVGDGSWASGRVNSSLKNRHEAHLEGALKEFHDKFRELACVPFVECEPPCQRPGGMHVNLIPGQRGKDVSAEAKRAAAAAAAAAGEAATAGTAQSALPGGVREFVELIFSEKMQQQQLESLNIDLEKMPLGGISDKQAEAGYAILCQLAAALKDPLPDGGAQHERLLALTNSFYNTIPHKFARKQTPPVITTQELLVEKVEALEALLQVSTAHSITAGRAAGSGHTAATHPADLNYEKLRCALQPADEAEVSMVREYAAKTHGATHNSYKLDVRHVLRADRRGESEAFKEGVGNRMLLWHGSRLTNWVGILSQGLRIAPPEAPVTGYMFGKGVYFADMVSKSANYCMATRESPKAVLLLCDVALGGQYELIGAQYEAAERSCAKGKDSTWGIGKTTPDPAAMHQLASGVKVPMGAGTKNAYLEDNLERLKAEGAGKRADLLYNEFIVYDVSQVCEEWAGGGGGGGGGGGERRGRVPAATPDCVHLRCHTGVSPGHFPISRPLPCVPCASLCCATRPTASF